MFQRYLYKVHTQVSLLLIGVKSFSNKLIRPLPRFISKAVLYSIDDKKNLEEEEKNKLYATENFAEAPRTIFIDLKISQRLPKRYL